MQLSDSERERIADGALKIQSVKKSLDSIDKSKIPEQEAVEDCLESIDESLREALGYIPPKK